MESSEQESVEQTDIVSVEEAQVASGVQEVQEEFVRHFRNAASIRVVFGNKTCFSPGYDDPSGIPYTKGCKFSPDGLCLLASSSDNKLRIFETLFQGLVDDNESKQIDPCLTMNEGELIYDFAWYPGMDSSNPDTCCFLTTSQYHPVHLFDAYNGQIRASYRWFDHMDELQAVRSISFDSSGSKIYCALGKAIRIFDIGLPGKDHLEERFIWTKAEGGQNGMISCLATNSSVPDIYAVGTFSRNVGIYSEPNGEAICILEGQTGGITHIQFSSDGTKLLAGGRKDNEILIWDLRNPGQLLASLRRNVSTNQRIFFDVHSINPNLVVSGGTDGVVKVWDVSQPPSQEDFTLKPLWENGEFQDCVNGVSFHPHEAAIATSTGQRHFASIIDSDDEDESMDDYECDIRVFRFKL